MTFMTFFLSKVRTSGFGFSHFSNYCFVSYTHPSFYLPSRIVLIIFNFSFVVNNPHSCPKQSHKSFQTGLRIMTVNLTASTVHLWDMLKLETTRKEYNLKGNPQDPEQHICRLSSFVISSVKSSVNLQNNYSILL